MIPLVGTVKELTDQKAIVLAVAAEVKKKYGLRRLPFTVGTMIEVPRAAITADEIAAEAEFFSFGTNDLTQMCCGFSRDDAGSFLPAYVEKKIYADDPFISLDAAGVGKLMRIAVQLGRGVAAGSQDGDLRRARRRPGLDPLLPRPRARLRVVQPVPRADRPAGGRAGPTGEPAGRRQKRSGEPRRSRSQEAPLDSCGCSARAGCEAAAAEARGRRPTKGIRPLRRWRGRAQLGTARAPAVLAAEAALPLGVVRDGAARSSGENAAIGSGAWLISA